MKCPDCNYETIAGADHCDKCGQPLSRFGFYASEMERSIMVRSVSVLGIKAPVSFAQQATVRTAIDEMNRQHIGCVLVTDSGNLVGIFTERDVLNRVLPAPGALDRPLLE